MIYLLIALILLIFVPDLLEFVLTLAYGLFLIAVGIGGLALAFMLAVG